MSWFLQRHSSDPVPQEKDHHPVMTQGTALPLQIMTEIFQASDLKNRHSLDGVMSTADPGWMGELAQTGPSGSSKGQHWLQWWGSGGAALCRFHAPHTRHGPKLSSSRHWALAQQLRSSNGSQMYEVFRHPAAVAARALLPSLALGGDMMGFSFFMAAVAQISAGNL